MSEMQSAQTNESMTSAHQAFYSGPTILLVEDEVLVREMTSEILELEGYQVLQARDAAEAMDMFRRFQPIVKVLLTDVVLPGQNGRSLADELRKLSPQLVTIFSSGYPVNAVTRQGFEDSSTLYLPKPFSATALLQKVSQALEQRSGGREIEALPPQRPGRGLSA